MACPYLATRSADGTYYSYPSRGNVCHAQPCRTRRRLFLWKRRPWVSIPRSRQQDLCLDDAAYSTCALCKHAAGKP